MSDTSRGATFVDKSTTTGLHLYHAFKDYHECPLAKYDGDVYRWNAAYTRAYTELKSVFHRHPVSAREGFIEPWFRKLHYLIMIDTCPRLHDWSLRIRRVSDIHGSDIPDVDELWRSLRDEVERLKNMKKRRRRRRRVAGGARAM